MRPHDHVPATLDTEHERGIAQELELSLEKREHPDWDGVSRDGTKAPIFSVELLQEVFLNPGLCLLFGGIAIGLISGLQGQKVTHDDDNFFVSASRACSACSCSRWA